MTRRGDKLIHWTVHIFLFLCFTSALWCHGHPHLSLALMSAAFPLALLPLLPTKYFPELARDVLQGLFFCGGFFWMVYRTSGEVPPDKSLAELITIFAYAFAFNATYRNYCFMYALGMVLLIYSAIFPRDIFFYFLPFSLLSALLPMYYFRTYALGAAEEAAPDGKLLRKSLAYPALHLLAAVAVAVPIYMILPSSNKLSKGYVTTSFMNEETSYLPPKFDKWFKNPQRQKSLEGLETMPGTGGTAGKKGPKVKTEKPADSFSVSGAGSPPGNDLLFRVSSPVKLYWMARLYDQYDGREWTCSDKMLRQHISRGDFYSSRTVKAETKFFMEKIVSPVLCTAYFSEYCSPIRPTDRISSPGYSLFVLEDPKKLPALPFQYSATASITLDRPVPSGPLPKGHDLWIEHVSQQHYLQLPDKKITLRLKQLAKEICAGAEDPYSKAVAIRDYLRGNFKYNMECVPPPDDRESTDFFVFELKEGHCEYFANALAVLARLNRLPARIATGYSPGDFNPLSGLFEVNERYAHAWTQIFIPGKGWLTFDATPPASLQSGSSPTLVGRIYDPFGDEWKITPPEITAKTQETLKTLQQQAARSGAEEGIVAMLSKNEKVSKVIMKLAHDDIQAQKDSKAQQKQLEQVEKESALAGIWTTFKKNLYSMKAQIIAMLKKGAALASGPEGLAAAAMLMSAGALYYSVPMIRDIIRKRRRLARCRRLLKEVPEQVKASPKLCLFNCCFMAKEYLELAGWPAPPSMDLLEYEATLEGVDERIRNDITIIFLLYSRSIYGVEAPSPSEASKAYDSVQRISARFAKGLPEARHPDCKS